MIINFFKNKIFNNFFKSYQDKKKFMIGNSHILNFRKNYKNIKNLNEVDYKIFSQNGEDGIIDYLLFSLKIEKPKFVEIGVGDYSESNTRFIFERCSSEGLIIDSIDNFKEKVSKNVKLWRGDIQIIQKNIDTENILESLQEYNFSENVDLFSLDIDGIDYWILKKLPKKFCKILVAEYNPYFGDKLKISVPNIKNFNRSKYHYSNLCFGASLKSIIDLMEEKGFIFVGSNIFKNNAFFVNIDFKQELSIEYPDKENLLSHVNANFRESRNKNNDLSYLSKSKIINEIENCEVVDLSQDVNNKIKIKDITN